MGVCEQTFYHWEKKFGGLMPSEVRKLRQLEEENARSRGLVGDLSLEKLILQEAARGNFSARPVAGNAIEHLQKGLPVSERRVSGVIGQPPAAQRYQATASDAMFGKLTDLFVSRRPPTMSDR